MEANKNQIAITPETKVGALLECYPQLEEVLIDLSPTFAKLKNPLLRKTIAKVATLQQVAKIGEVELGVLINTLRKAVGQGSVELSNHPGGAIDTGMPEWMHDPRIVKSLDARPIIEAGEHPMGTVLSDLKSLGDGEVYELITPFLPEPLIAIIRGKGFECWTTPPLAGQYRNYFTPGKR